jgi:ADP-heptose:LPS heptosyltransferase
MGLLRRLFFLRWGPRPGEYRRILVFLLLPIGDTLFATPTIRALRCRYPHARIDALVYPTNAGILEGNPDLDRVFVYPTRQTWRGLLDYLRLLGALHGRRYDLGVECSPYLWWLSMLCGIPYRLFLDMPIPHWFFPIGRRPWSKRHAIENIASLLAPLGLPVDTSRVIVQPTPASRAAGDLFLRDHGSAVGTTILGIHPGGEGFRGLKRWGSAQFAETARTLAARHGAHVLIFGGPDEVKLAAEVAALIGPAAIALGGKVSLGVATALLERCFLFIGNDSAPLHMAAAAGIPTLGIFGPTNPTNYRPVGRHVAIVRSGIPCSPCFSFVGTTTLFGGSQCQDNQCLKHLSVARVVGAAEQLLRRARALPPAARSGDELDKPAAGHPAAQVDALARG